MRNLRRTRTISDSESTELPDIVSVEESIEHHASRDNLNAINAIVLCGIWCSISVVNNIVSKTLLNSFPYPLTLTLSQLVATAFCAEPVVRIWGIPHIHWEKIDSRYILLTIIPLGIGKFLAACGTHISVSKLPVSYAHTVKASMPIFVVLISTFVFHEYFSLKIYGSLLVIFMGVAIASITELEFDTLGLISALLATLAFALLNILTKKCLNFTHMHQFRLLLMLGRISSLMFLPIWIYHDLFTFISAHTPLSSNFSVPVTLFLLVSDGVMNFSQNLIAFTLIAKVTPVSYAVCNVVKRIAVITLSIVFFRNPVTIVNIFGTLTAIFGVFLYNMVKTHQKSPIQSSSASSLSKSARYSTSTMNQDSCTIYIDDTIHESQEKLSNLTSSSSASTTPLPGSMLYSSANGGVGGLNFNKTIGQLVPIPSQESLINFKTDNLLHIEKLNVSPSRAFANDDSRDRRIANSSVYFHL